MRCLKGVVPVALAILGGSGCAGLNPAVTIYDPIYSQLYSNGDFEYAAQRGEIRTEVVGSPFGIPQQAFSDHVREMMRGANWGPTVDFTADATAIPPETSVERFHVAVLFNPPVSFPADEACIAPEGGNGLLDGANVRMLAAFCYGDKLMSQAAGRAAGVSGVDDPKFRSLVRGVTLAMIPPYDRKDIGSDGGGVIP